MLLTPIKSPVITRFPLGRDSFLCCEELFHKSPRDFNVQLPKVPQDTFTFTSMLQRQF